MARLCILIATALLEPHAHAHTRTHAQADVRGIVFPRLSLETIATVLDKLNFPNDPAETRQLRQARAAAEGALRKCAQQLARSEGGGGFV